MAYIIPIAALILVLYCPFFWARHVLNKYNQEEYFSGSGCDLASLLLERMELGSITVEETELVDHFDPDKMTVRLHRERCEKKTLTAVVVAAHEVGHVIQFQSGYRPLDIRTRLIRSAVKLEKLGAGIMMIVPLFTAVTRAPVVGVLMVAGGILSLCVPLMVHFITLPVEFDASFKRALPMLTQGRYIPEEDVPFAKKILLACALTYVANALVGLLNVWRWIRLLRR